MAALQRGSQSSVGTAASSSAPCTAVGSDEKSVSDQFPVGLKVLVVDDDVICLRIVEQMLRRCHYHVTTCSKATLALKLLREKKGGFDVVLSDVYMPDIDGYKLLEHVGLEMDLPVIMMSADGSTSAVMKGIRHGACDYLIKPIREEELKNIWQHVVRKKWNGNKEFEQTGSLDDNGPHRRTNDDAEYASSINEEIEGLKNSKKRGISKEEDDSEPDNDDPSSSKKPRVVWSVELHQQFVSAVNQLGLDKAVPKRILELMNVPGLTRENVASHLQKFRLYLKRLSGGPQQSGISNAFCGSIEPNVKLGTLGRFDIQALAASGHIPPQTLTALHAEFLGRPAGNLGPPMDQPALVHASLLGPKRLPVEHGLVFGQPQVKCQSNIFKQLPTSILSIEDASRFGAWAPNDIATVMVGPINNVGGLNNQNSNFLVDILQQQKQLVQQQPVLPESSRSINVQPSCLVVPTQSSTSFQAASPASVNQNCSFNRVIDYSILSPPSNNPVINGMSNGENKTSGILCGFSAAGSSTLTSSLSGDRSVSCQNPTLRVSGARQLPGHVLNIADIQGSYGDKSSEMLDQGPLRNLGYVGKGTFIPSQFATDEYESPMSNLNHRKVYSENSAIPVKQEPNLEFLDNEAPALRQFAANDLMSVFTK